MRLCGVRWFGFFLPAAAGRQEADRVPAVCRALSVCLLMFHVA